MSHLSTADADPDAGDSSPLLPPSSTNDSDITITPRRFSLSENPSLRAPRRRRRKRSLWAVFAPLLLLLSLGVLSVVVVERFCLLGVCGDEGGDEAEWEVWDSQGPYAPFRSRRRMEEEVLPGGCEISQVTILHRHGARYPTASQGDRILTTLRKLAHRNRSITDPNPSLQWLKGYDWRLGDWEWGELTDLGRKEAWKSGKEMRARYRTIPGLDMEQTFVRSSGGGRVVETAGYWLRGFHGKKFKLGGKGLGRVDVVVPEGPGMNNTLDAHTCRNDEEGVDPNKPPPPTPQSTLYLPLLAPHLLPHLNRLLAPSPAFTSEDVLPLLSMCGYNAQAWLGVNARLGDAGEGYCGLLKGLEKGKEGGEREGWEGYGWWYDLDKYYGKGQGSEYGAQSGAGYVNELIARLTDSPVEDATTTNRTMDDDEEVFPRGGRRMFVDFSHDNQMVQIAAAMSLFKERKPLSISYPPPPPDGHEWRLANIVPFGARWIFERVTCGGVGVGEAGDYVRVFVNDRLEYIDHPSCDTSEFGEHGLCRMDKFLESQAFARGGGEWEKCFEDQEEG